MATTLLDPSAPFVRTVLAIVDHGADYEDAITTLVAAEKRHGIRILRDDTTGSLATVWVPLQTPRPTLRELRALLARFPRTRDGRIDDAELETFDRARRTLYRDGTDDETPDTPLFAFLTETSLLLGGTDFANDHWIEFPDGALGSWTQRAWGERLSQWARSHQPRLAPMDYAVFTYYCHTLEPRYEAWCTTALEVIRRKCERQLDE